MAEKNAVKVIHRHVVSNRLALFRIARRDGSPFPEYVAGQYVALHRDNCKLTQKTTRQNGEVSYRYDLDESGNQKRGTVTQYYSISSAPYETRERGYIELYVAVNTVKGDHTGIISDSIFQDVSDGDLIYCDEIGGDFTLEKRAAGYDNVVMVGTGTGLAPFVSMIKQIHYDALRGKNSSVRHTLFHANRTYEELGYHRELMEIQSARKFDFIYVPSVSRPTQHDYDDPELGKGRSSNLLRFVFGMPSEEQAGRTNAIPPILPKHQSPGQLQSRMDHSRTVILACGNSNATESIKSIALAKEMRFEKEEW